MRLLNALLVLSVGFLTSTAHAEDLHALSDVEQAAYVFALNEAQASYDNPQIVVEPLDKRLRLQQCESDLQAFSSPSANAIGKRTIGVKCAGPTSWTVYVPVKVKVMKPVVVAARPLVANRTLQAGDLRVQNRDIGDLRKGYLASKSEVIGKQLKYPLAVGTVLPSRGLKQQTVVRRGEQIILVATAGTMEVRMNGTAMEDASVGERVKVKNSSSKRVVEGIVDAPGVVKVTM
jgi:flagella basal body P-ring formation protein FlgA